MRTGIAFALIGVLTFGASAARADDPAPAAAAPTPVSAGDPGAGKTVFGKCAACHAVVAGQNKVGPSLYGVVGRHSASVAGFNYSEAMKATNWDWTPEQLNTYLVEPRAVVVGTKMIFAGLKADTDRANVIAYLSTLK